jgi:hypothetical protein
MHRPAQGSVTGSPNRLVDSRCGASSGRRVRLRLIFAYTIFVPSRSCRVSFTDAERIQHSVRVVEQCSLYWFRSHRSIKDQDGRALVRKMQDLQGVARESGYFVRSRS